MLSIAYKAQQGKCSVKQTLHKPPTSQLTATYIQAQHPRVDLRAQVAPELRVRRAFDQLAVLVQNCHEVSHQLTLVGHTPKIIPPPSSDNAYPGSTTWARSSAGRAPRATARTASWSQGRTLPPAMYFVKSVHAPSPLPFTPIGSHQAPRYWRRKRRPRAPPPPRGASRRDQQRASSTSLRPFSPV